MWLVQLILSNHKTPIPGKGMPLGNLTSQFFANVYLHELDIFVKHELKVKYYLRYVDDFIILSGNKQELEFCLKEIGCFLDERLHVSLHTQKTRIIPLHMGVPLLGFRMFYHYRLLKKSNARRIRMRLEAFRAMMAKGEMGKIEVLSSFAGWDGYARMADTFRLRQTLRKEVEGMLRVCWC